MNVLFTSVSLSLLALGCARYIHMPVKKQFQNAFQKNVEDFMELIETDVGKNIKAMTETYLEHDEFWNTMAYLQGQSFMNLIVEIERSQEFKDVMEFLDKRDIDVMYLPQTLIGMLDDIIKITLYKPNPYDASGNDLDSYLKDMMSILPKQKLARLYDQKIEEEEEFRVAMEYLQSVQWEQTLNAMLYSDTFLNADTELRENGVDFRMLVHLVKGVFGLNTE